MDVKPLGGALGAEIVGVDIRDPSDSEVADIYATLLDHEVVFFRDTKIDDDQHLAFAGRFGTPSVFPLSAVMGETEPSFQVIADGPDSEPATDYWHTDVTWIAEPPHAAFLRATIVPDHGGDTMWGSMTAAYDALSPAVQDFLSGLRVRHDNTSFIEGMIDKLGEEMARPLAQKLREAYPSVEHPLIRTHSETGRKAIFFGGGFMREILGLTSSESDAILDFLRRHIDQPIFHARWRWTLGDLALWDQRSTVHRGLADHFPRKREVRRCVIDGDRPS
ncbi:MAG: taurine dioxygenase [bacterium]|nr:taurine dioxygenase [Deltaproteobacteria bacterium]MCP4906991.1 taurine dioxygenase [bacterium]